MQRCAYGNLVLQLLLIFTFLFSTQAFAQTSADADYLYLELQETKVVDSNKIPSKITVGVGDKATDFTILTAPPTEQGKLVYDSLTDDQKTKFHQARVNFFQLLTSVFVHTRLTLGTGIAVGKELIQAVLPPRLETYNGLASIHPFYENLTSQKDWMKQSSDLSTLDPISPREALQKRVKIVRKAGNDAIQGLISALDHTLWEGAKQVVDRKEWGLFYIRGLGFEAGLKKGIGGEAALAVILAYNKEKKSLVFQIKRMSEAFSSGFVISATTFFRFGYYSSSANKATISKGRTFNPPSPIPLFASVTEDAFYVGFNIGDHGLTKSPWDVFNGYENTHSETTLFRLEISARFKNMIKIESLIFQDAKNGVVNLKNYGKKLVKTVKSILAPSTSCRAIYL